MVLVFLSLVLMTFIVGFNNFIIYTVRGCCILSSTQIWICTNPNVKLTLLAPSSFPKGQWQYAIGMKSEMRNAHEWSCKAIVQLLVFPKRLFPFFVKYPNIKNLFYEFVLTNIFISDYSVSDWFDHFDRKEEGSKEDRWTKEEKNKDHVYSVPGYLKACVYAYLSIDSRYAVF